MSSFDWAHPELFWLLLLIPALVGWYFFKGRKQQFVMKHSGGPALAALRNQDRSWLRHVLFGIKMLAFTALIIALARPQSQLAWQNVDTEGIDIVISLDISGSMLARDFKPNRLEAAKDVAVDFIKERQTDRMGLVVYSGRSFTQCPLTTDKDVLINLMEDIKNGMIQDGTAIGNGLATAVDRLRDSEAKSKVVILLSDGTNNAGEIPPLTAAEIAEKFDVRVYTIGVGTNGQAPFPVRLPTGQTTYEMMEVQIDEKTLTSIADMTGGRYFRATDNKSLEMIYSEIDQLEKTKVEVTEFRKKKEEFYAFAGIGIILLLAEFLVRSITQKSID